MKGIIVRIIHQMKNDRRTLALMVIAPLMILTLLFFLLSESDYRPLITVDSSVPPQLVDELQRQQADIIVLDSALDWTDDSVQPFAVDQQLLDGDADALLRMDQEGLHIRVLETDGTKLGKITAVLKSALAELNPAAGMSISQVYGSSDDTLFDSLAYVLLGLLSFFFVFIIAGISFVRERDTGTLERLMISPIRRVSVVGGYTIGYGIFTILQSILMIAYSHYVLGLDVVGSIPLSIFVMVLLAFSAVSSGALVSIFANNEFQVMQFIPIVIIPQYFFSGLIAIDTLPYGLGKIAYIMPVFYGCTALKEIMIKGNGLADIWFQLIGLVTINLLLFTLNVFALKKYRQL
ncbi:MAG: ABC transporter permease [Eubacteriales bacterium]|nr:ABC transporter permease [Eubacteriales bacterium]